MANIFLSHRFHGEDQKELEYILGGMKESLESANHVVTCSLFMSDFFKLQKFTTNDIYDYMLKIQKECDVFMPVIWSTNQSKGMKLESDLAVKLRQRYILVRKEGVIIPEYVEASHKIITFSNYEQLFRDLKYFK